MLTAINVKNVAQRLSPEELINPQSALSLEMHQSEKKLKTGICH